ncbi:MAG: hypothetical protein KHY80_02480 [Eggerthella sp.]|nr:hypothetical protein [Eggerthella sp.]
MLLFSLVIGEGCDAGVAEGLKRPQAQQIAAQAVLGSAKLVLESGKHPGQLKDEVCSPFGSTIRGVVVLEKGAFRGTVIDALRAAIARARSPQTARKATAALQTGGRPSPSLTGAVPILEFLLALLLREC